MVKGLAILVSFESSLLVLQTAAFWLSLHLAFPSLLQEHGDGVVRGQISGVSFYKGTHLVVSGPPLIPHLTLILP